MWIIQYLFFFSAQVVADKGGGVWSCQPRWGSGPWLRIRILAQCGQKWIHAGGKVGIRQTVGEHKQERNKKVIIVECVCGPIWNCVISNNGTPGRVRGMQPITIGQKFFDNPHAQSLLGLHGQQQQHSDFIPGQAYHSNWSLNSRGC